MSLADFVVMLRGEFDQGTKGGDLHMGLISKGEEPVGERGLPAGPLRGATHGTEHPELRLRIFDAEPKTPNRRCVCRRGIGMSEASRAMSCRGVINRTVFPRRSGFFIR